MSWESKSIFLVVISGFMCLTLTCMLDMVQGPLFYCGTFWLMFCTSCQVSFGCVVRYEVSQYRTLDFNARSILASIKN